MEPSSTDLSWLSGGGDMGKLIRSMDWSQTALGPVETWPQSLRTSVSLCLSSTFPILVAWGPEDIQIYNDAYRPICGDLHPASMGQNFKICWASALPVVGDAFDRAHEGEGTYIRDQRMFLDRYGYLEEAFMTFSFSPIRVESGNVGGVFHPISESTDKVLAARRTQGLRELTAHIAKSRTVTELCTVTAEQHPALQLDLPFLLIYTFDDDGTTLQLGGHAGLPVGCPLTIDKVAIDQASTWPFGQTIENGTLTVLSDLAARFGDFVCEPYPEAPHTAVLLPITVAGQEKPFGFVVAGVSARRALDKDYESFYELLMNAFNTAVGNIVAYEQEQKRAEALAAIDRAKTVFFSNVSHEFRTPLTLMLGPLEDALADTEEVLSETQRERLDVTHRNAQRLLKLVNGLLDFSRIEAGRIQAHYVKTDLARLTEDLASVFRSAMEKAGLDYRVSVAPTTEDVYVDRDMWEKIVFNLLSNAFKFTLQGSVNVHLAQEDDTVRLSVHDTGTGVPAHELPRLFERFHRIETAQGRTYEGSGIGLALVQELVKLHGGSIDAESTLDVGTTFHVTLPLGHEHLPAENVSHTDSEPNASHKGAAFLQEALSWLPDAATKTVALAQTAETTAETLLTQPARILIADDNSDMRSYIRHLFEKQAIVETCADGEEAYEAILRSPPDLLLSDVMMPRLDGFGLIHKIRNTPEIHDVPIILLSARAGEEARLEGLQAGADDYLVKPFSAKELQAQAQRQIHISRQRKASRHVLEENVRYFQSLVDSSPAILWLTDDKGMCTYLSRRWQDYTGRNAKDDLGTGWQEAIHPADAAAIGAQFAQAVADRTRFSFDYRLLRRDGEYRWVVDAGSPYFDEHNNFIGHVGTLVDIHDTKVLADDLSESNRRQSEFLVTLAHELRNPLAPIRNGLELLRMSEGKLKNAANVQRMIERQVGHLTHLVDDLLDTARITRGKINLKKADTSLNEVLGDAIEISMPLIEASRHRLTVDNADRNLHLAIDRHRIAQVVSNLLNNAAKYTPAGGNIHLSVTQNAKQVVISVRDDGVGIPTDALATVFGMFTQIPNHIERAQGGLGIGLYLVKRLVELHDGDVRVESAGSGLGSNFIVTLPLRQSIPEQAPQAVEKPETGNPASLRILVVDDNEDAASSLAEIMTHYGHQTRAVHRGREALLASMTFKPQMVFLDIGLPDMTGYEVLEQLQKLPDLHNTLFVALTGWGSEADIVQAKQVGFHHHLTKPASVEALGVLLATRPQDDTFGSQRGAQLH
ncbi:ATP-binding protein [uncultured Oxalicibacterium sp.]|uniref:ATP-binding protein n=1 Tax=uncultured Oxalicibacterium sp. TaxID=1168540 RepID=UPI0025E94DB2|nr:ATP-binding protein [uncultured Oxalicibacterium sp.]